MEPDPSLEWLEQKALIIGRAYPEPSKRHIETVCTGAITEDGRLLRLYPISWRYLDQTQQYRLWAWAKFDISKSQTDRRKESYRVREETIEVLSYVGSDAERYSLLKNAISPDREALDRRYRQDWTSIGIVEIEVLDFLAKKPRLDWAKDKPYTQQGNLLVDVKPLEQAPVDLKLKFRCKNNPACKTHLCRLIGWEYMEAFRNYRRKYGSDQNTIAMMKDAVTQRFCKPGTSVFALLGTHSRYPAWMIGQLYVFDQADTADMLF